MVRWEYKCDVYVDGSCINNNKPRKRAGGVGIVFHPSNIQRNLSIPLDSLDSVRPTNQRAELSALLKTFRLILQDLKDTNDTYYTCFTDSQYAIKCINEWSNTWVRKYGPDYRNWKNSKGTPVVNARLINTARNFYIQINQKYNQNRWKKFELTHVRGHADNELNNEADRLAYKAAKWSGFRMKNGLQNQFR